LGCLSALRRLGESEAPRLRRLESEASTRGKTSTGREATRGRSETAESTGAFGVVVVVPESLALVLTETG